MMKTCKRTGNCRSLFFFGLFFLFFDVTEGFSAGSPRQEICSGQPIPSGWILVDVRTDFARCGGGWDNIWIMASFKDLPIGALLTVCAHAPIPPGWTLLNTSTDFTKCGQNSPQNNLKTIRRISEDLPPPNTDKHRLTAEEIIDRIYRLPRPKDSIAEISMIATHKGEQKAYQLKVFSKTDSQDKTADTKRLIQVLSPPDDRGISLLIWTNHGGLDDLWLYLPSSGKSSAAGIHKIAPSNQADMFLSTDLSYFDLQIPESDEHIYKLADPEKIGPFNCFKIEAYPRLGVETIYSQSNLWVEQESFVIIQVELFDRSRKLLKRFTVDRIEAREGYWTPLQCTLQNLQKKSKTLLKLQKIDYNRNLDDHYFTKNYMESGF